MIYKCLSIAGFDGSGGAGIQADLKTFSALGCYGMNILTMIAVQNTCGVRSCYPIPAECIKEQMQAIFDDIIPDAIKIGALFSVENITCIADYLSKHAVNIPIVLDPVMFATSGDVLLETQAIDCLKQVLIPLATLITPNLPEAKQLIGNIEDKMELAQQLLSLGCKNVLLKGGHENTPTCDDILLTDNTQTVLSTQRIASNNTHGTGCTLSAAITSLLAKGLPLPSACQAAKNYLSGAIAASQDLQIGHGRGPLQHFYKGVIDQSPLPKRLSED